MERSETVSGAVTGALTSGFNYMTGLDQYDGIVSDHKLLDDCGLKYNKARDRLTDSFWKWKKENKEKLTKEENKFPIPPSISIPLSILVAPVAQETFQYDQKVQEGRLTRVPTFLCKKGFSSFF